MSADETIVHVRFAPDGQVVEIGARPQSLTPQQWFNWLSANAGTHYRTLAGGRGVFCLPPSDVDMLQRTATAA